jgi:hypothetical protein
MGFLDSLLGRSKPVKSNLDDLFALPSAALTLQAAMGLTGTGTGAVCFKAAEGSAFASMQAEVEQLLAADGVAAEQVRDSYGYTWLVCKHDPDDMSGLVTELHAINSSLVDAGFGQALLCSVVGFTGVINGEQRTLALVYLYRRGTFYPFAPLPGEKRDNALELQLRGVIGADLKIEPDLARWFPVWGAPGL